LLKIVLPLAIPKSGKSEYEEKLSEESLKEFEELKKKAVSSYSLKKQSLADEYAPQKPPKEAEGQAYKDAGKFIVNHCDILIALWDHNQPKSRTSWIVNYAREKKCPMYIIYTSKLSEFHLSETETKKGKTGRVQNLLNYLRKCSLFKQLLPLQYHPDLSEGVKTFNSHITNSKISDSAIDKELNNLLSPELKAALPDQIQKDIKEKLIPYRLISAEIARNNQEAHQNVGIRVFISAFIAVCLVSIGIIFFHSH